MNDSLFEATLGHKDELSARIRAQSGVNLPFAAHSLLATAIALALSTSVGAADMEEITVEGENGSAVQSPKFTAPLLDTPKSVTIISSELMEERGATSLVEALRNVPGVTFNAGEGGQPAGDNLKIRGFDAGSDVYIDGIRDAGSQTRDIFALEQIEVVKGPASTYSGRGSSGGTVNLATKTARAGSFATASLGGGTDDYLRAAIDANYQINDSAALRLNVLDHSGEVAGRDAVEFDHQGIAPSLTLGLNGNTRLYLDYYYYRTDDIPDYSFPYGRNADNTAPEGEPVVVDRNNFYGLVNRDFQKTGADVATLRVTHQFNENFSIRNSLRWGETSNDYIVTNPDDSRANVANGFVLRNTKSRNSETETLANQFDLLAKFSTGGVAHSLATGLEISRETMFNQGYSVATTFGSNANSDPANSCSAPGVIGPASNYNCTSLANPNPYDPWTGSIEKSSFTTDVETNTYSLYALDTLSLNERWLVNLGVRYDNYETEQESFSARAENKEDFVNYQLGLVYKPSANASLYLATGTSSNPSGNTLGDGSENLSSANEDLEPERDRTYELGAKWSLLDNRVNLAAALFRTEKTNARVSVEPGRGAPQDTVGEQRVDGVELSINGYITPAWNVFASYTLLDSEIVDDGPVAENDGNQFPNTPENSFNLWTSYAPTEKWVIGAGANFVDKRYGNTSNSVFIDSYWRYDAMIGYEVNDKLSLQLNALNITDEVYFDRPYAAHYAAIAPARSVVLKASFSF